MTLSNLSDWFKGLNLVSRINRELKRIKCATFFADSSFVVVDLDKFGIWMVGRLPAISVCIPTYNGAKYIAQTIESILNQTFTDFEIIVSDDGSSDKTLEIVGSFNDPRIVRIDRLSKVGAEANWNNAVANASASLVKLVCQDDLLYPQCLEVEV